MAGVLDFIQNKRDIVRQDAQAAERARGIRSLTGSPGVDLEGVPGLFPAERVGGLGLLQDPNDLENQVRFAAGVEQLPGGGGLGLLADIFREEGATERSTAANEQRDVASQRTTGASLLNAQNRIAEEQRQFALTSGIDSTQAAADEARRVNKEERDRLAGVRAAEDQAAERLTRPRKVVNPLPRALGGPGGGETLVDPTKTAGNQMKLDTAGLIIGNVNEFVDLLDTFGSEFINDEARGQMAALRSGILLRASSLREAGAPQAAELEINAQALPDPNTFGAKLNPFEKDRFLASWNTFGEEMKQNYLDRATADPSTSVDWDLLGPGFLEKNDVGPAMLEFIKANRGRDVPLEF